MELLLEEKKAAVGDGRIFCTVKESKAYFAKKVSGPTRPNIGKGQFVLDLDVMALQGDVYIPISLASGKKATGFVYQIEGTAEGSIATTDISCRGTGVTKITVGTLLYAKIPTGSTATFRMVFNIEGGLGKLYKIIVSRINYKINPSDARYKKFDAAISTKTLKFK